MLNRIFSAIAFFVVLLPLGVSAQLDQKLTSASRISMTLSNFGMIGNSFRGVYNTLAYPSCQYPGRNRNEHLFNGGLWVGGVKGPSKQLLVTTGAFASSTGYSPGSSNYEFQPNFGEKLNERSNRKSQGSKYSPNAVSHQDFYSTFYDTSRFATVEPRTLLVPIPGHFPMGLKVEFESYNWDFSSSNFFVVLNFKITNINTNPDDYIDSIHTGFWTDPVIRSVANVPPTGTPFFSQGGSGYIDSLDLGYEFDASTEANQPAIGSYFALKFLGAKDKLGFRYPSRRSSVPYNANFSAFYNTWNFNVPDPLFFGPSSETERFGRLSSGLNKRTDFDLLQQTIKSPFNRSMLISQGPYARLAPGESMTVTYAVICASATGPREQWNKDGDAQRLNLQRHARLVQNAYLGNDRDYDGKDDVTGTEPERFILPEPPTTPSTKVISKDNTIEIYWGKEAEESVDRVSKQKDFAGYRIYRSNFGFEFAANPSIDSALRLVKEYDLKGDKQFFETGFDAIKLPEPMKFAGDTATYYYKYTISNVQNGWQTAVALTAFDTGDPVNGVESQETEPTSNMYQAFAGTAANKDLEANAPFVYPNPYYGNAAWERQSGRPEDKKLYFANLPARANIKVFSTGGDLIDEFKHESTSFGRDNGWYTTFTDANKPVVTSGGEHSWDLLSRYQQIISPGLYQFTVEDLDSGKSYIGKFVIIK